MFMEGLTKLQPAEGPRKRSERNRDIRRVAARFRHKMDIVSEENEKLKTQLRQTQKFDSIGQLVGGVVHDINHMLCPINSCAELIRISNAGPDKTPKNRDIEENAVTILSSVERMGGLLKKFLGLSRESGLGNVQIDMHVIIPEVVVMLRHTLDKKILARQRLDATHSFIVGDPAQMESAIFNLALNAKDAMPDGGLITIQTRNFTMESTDAKPLGQKFIEISISDTGMGMSEDVKKKIFVEHFTTKEFGKGSGFGLSNVYETVKSHGGAITFSSDLGKGTIFRIYLPYVEPKAAEKAQAAALGVGQTLGKVLIVDDESSVAESTSDLLEVKGYSVLNISENGKMALDYYRAHWQEIDVIILDLIMPEMNGLECFNEIRKVNPKARVVLYSGCSEDDAARMQEIGVNGFLSKPFSPKQLTDALKSALRD